MNDKTDVHILVWRLRPPYNVHVNVHVGFVIYTSTKRKKSTFNSLINGHVSLTLIFSFFMKKKKKKILHSVCSLRISVYYI